MISLPVKLSPKQIGYLREIKRIHGISMAGQIRTLIKRDMFGIVPTATNPKNESGPERSIPVQVGPSGYSSVVMELNKVFSLQRRKRGGLMAKQTKKKQSSARRKRKKKQRKNNMEENAAW